MPQSFKHYHDNPRPIGIWVFFLIFLSKKTFHQLQQGETQIESEMHKLSTCQHPEGIILSNLHRIHIDI